MYFKYHVNNNKLMSTDTVSVFDAVKDLFDNKKLEAEEVRGYFDSLEVVENILSKPSFDEEVELSKSQIWFKNNEYSEELLETVEFYVKVLKKHNSSIVLTRCNTPGRIIYEDDYQIRVVQE